MKKALSVILFIILLNKISYSQNIFPEKFEGCNTDQFALENDSVVAKINVQEFIKVVFLNVDKKITGNISGTLSFQIIVDLEGKSCLISLKNETNTKTKKLNLKATIDNNLIWEKPKKKVSPIIVLNFKDGQVYFSRLGLNGNTGWHELPKT